MSEVVALPARTSDREPPPDVPFAELVAATNYSFLDGASHAEDMVAQAVAIGLTGLGIADRNTVAGVVRAHKALRKVRQRLVDGGFPDIDFRLVAGARLVFADGTPDIVAYPATRHGWGRLTRLLTVGNLRAEKGGCLLGLGDLIGHLDDLLLIVTTRHGTRPAAARKDAAIPPSRPGGLAETLALLVDTAPGRVWLGVSMPRAGRDERQLSHHAALADRLGIPLLATADALYATIDDRPLHDVVTCIREGSTVAAAGRLLAANGERHLKPGEEMARLFRRRPDAVEAATGLLGRISFDLLQLSYEYPHEPVPPGWNPQDWLEHLTWEAAHARFPDGVPAKLETLLAEELPLIRERDYACYFLTVHDVVRFARSLDPPILCQGRGSAANSAVCWLLGVTSVDPLKYDLLFSRFVSSERDEPPDIDIDFEHERREEVMQYIYARYGRHRAAIAATVIHYRPRSAVREVGKALGLTEDVTQRLGSTVWGSFAGRLEDQRFEQAGFDLAANPEMARLRDLVGRIMEFPRHLSQHVGGFVLTQGRLDETVPIHHGAMAGRTFIEWDKDDIDYLKIMKVDILALGMLTCIRKAFDLMEGAGLGRPDLGSIAEDEHPAVYDMLCKGDSIGVFQVESRAQINMLPRLRPRCLYDLVVQVAIVRPGPIEGDMVHPYLRRRAGKEAVDFPSPSPPHDPDELRNLLRFTYGVPLFQEQAMKLAIVAAEFTPNEANQLRRAMATFRNLGGMEDFEAKLVNGMVRRGYPQDFAERCYKQIEGFGSYGFPESHALSFARLVYVSSWLKCFHPAVFGCAILNAQPMGFYAPAQLVQDARDHGVVVRPVDVNASFWDNALEPCDDDSLAIRLGLRQVDGFREEWAGALVAARTRVFASVEEVAARAALPPRALRLLAGADALGSLDHSRRTGVWEVARTPPKQLSLFAAAGAAELGTEPDLALPAMPPGEEVAADYQTTRLSLKDHPMRFLRPVFAAEGVLSSAEAARARDGRRARIAGVVLVRQRPGKGNAIFVTIEDETGITNALLWARDFEANRRAIMAARLLVLEGVIQKSEEGVVHLMTTRAEDRTAELSRLSSIHQANIELSRADVFVHPQPPRSRDPRHGSADPGARPPPRGQHPRNVRIMPPSRDFH